MTHTGMHLAIPTPTTICLARVFVGPLQLAFRQYLAAPGADIVVCDEGHRLKNTNSRTYQAMLQIATTRRVRVSHRRLPLSPRLVVGKCRCLCVCVCVRASVCE
jgi:hypothetical protein